VSPPDLPGYPPTFSHPSRTRGNGSTTFQSWDRSGIISGFSRSATVGTVTLDCQVAFFGTDACGGGPKVTLSYAAPAVSVVQ
jgi:hypothetical protein